MKFQHTAGVISVASIFVVSVVAAGQDRFTLTSPNGIAFSEFKGYDAWQLVSPSNVDGGVNAILGNAVMIKAFSEGIPADGQPVPDGAVMAKIEWSSKDNSDLPGAAMVADTLKNVGFMVKDAKRFPETDGWGYAQFNYDVGSGVFKPLGSEPDSRRRLVTNVTSGLSNSVISSLQDMRHGRHHVGRPSNPIRGRKRVDRAR